MHDKKARTLVVVQTARQGRDTRSLATLPADIARRKSAQTLAHDLKFAPGQVAVLSTADSEPAYYAVASAPSDERLEFLIKRGTPTSDALHELPINAKLFLHDIAGTGFPLDTYHGKDLIMIAMGTGVAPLRSALRHALSQSENFGQIFLLYGARTPADFHYQTEVDSWRAAGVDLREVISQPEGYDWSGSTGYVQSLIDNIMPQLSDPIALVCGSAEMVEHTRDRLHEMGFAEEKVLTNF